MTRADRRPPAPGRPPAGADAAGRRRRAGAPAATAAVATGTAAAAAPCREAACAAHAELRRRQILDAAAECFRARGFHNASMAEIARTFGMSAGHIYNYFDSKEAIIAGIVARDLGEFMQRAAAVGPAAADVQRAFLDGVDLGIADKLNPAKSSLQLEVLAEAGRNPAVRAMVQDADTQVRGVLRELLGRTQAGGHRERDLDGKVAVLMALFDGLLVRGLRQPELDRDQLTRVLRAVLHDLMR